jgi:hypothetical protein
LRLLKVEVYETLIMLVSRFETWGKKILTAVEAQGRLLSSLTEGGRNGLPRSDQLLRLMDTPWTPITGSDMILNWSVFPQEKPVGTFPSSEYTEKTKPSDLGRCKCLSLKKNSFKKKKNEYV